MTASTPYTRRDSATAALRKLGIEKTDYHRFIDVLKDEDGTLFVVDVDAAKAFVARAAAPKVVVPVKLDPVGNSEAAKRTAAQKGSSKAITRSTSPKGGRPVAVKSATRSVSSVARALLAAGKTNEQVWAVIKAEFKLDDGKKGYPAWYRAEMLRKGLLKK